MLLYKSIKVHTFAKKKRNVCMINVKLSHQIIMQTIM